MQLSTLKSRVVATVLTLSSIGALGIVGHEGMKRVAYVDPVGVVTVCAGHTATAKLGQVKTEQECAELLKSDVKHAESAVKRLVKAPITQNQFDALTSFVFNIGETSFAKSTLLKKININDCWGAGAEFSKWTYAGGKELPGLIKRRADERKHWETGCAKGNYKTSTTRGLEQRAPTLTVGHPTGRRAIEPFPVRWFLVDGVR
jgi:lysozyme